MTDCRLRSILIALLALVGLMLPALRADANSKCDFYNENDAYLDRYAVKVDGEEVGEEDPAALSWNTRGYVIVRRHEDPGEVVDHWNIRHLPEEDDIIDAYSPVEAE